MHQTAMAKVLTGLLLPFLVVAQNSTSSNSTTSTGQDGLLSSGNVEMGDWAEAYAKAQALVAQMTNEEKISVVTAGSVESVGWAAMQYKDGTQGPQGTYHSIPYAPLPSNHASQVTNTSPASACPPPWSTPGTNNPGMTNSKLWPLSSTERAFRLSMDLLRNHLAERLGRDDWLRGWDRIVI